MASIPLPALHVDTTGPSPLAQYAQLSQIQNAQSQRQTQALQQTALQQENQQRALQLQDAQTLRSLAPNHVTKDADGNVTGFDTQGLIKEAASKGVNPSTLNQMQNQYAESVKNLASANEAVRNNEVAKNKMLYETLESLRGIQDPQQRQAALTQALPNLQKQGVDTSKLQGGNVPLDDKSLDLVEAGLGMHAQMLADAKTAAETQAELSKKITADTEAKKFAATLPGGQLENPEQKFLRLNSAQTEGKPLSADDKAFIQSYKTNKTMVPQFNLNLAANTGAGKPAADVAKQFGMTPEAFDQAAEKYYQTGNMPQMGRNAQGMALQRAVMNRTAELHPGTSLAEGSAEYKANAESLKKLQGNLDSVSAFENTALKNLKLFRDQAQKVIDTGIPLINAPVRDAAKVLFGSESQAGMETALQVANNEIAKVTSSPGLSGVLSDSARKEVEAYNPKSATFGQAMHVADILEQDMKNRHESYQQQINDIKGRMSTTPASTSTTNKVLSPADWLAQQKKGTNP